MPSPLTPYLMMGKLIALLGAVAIICWQSSQIHRWHTHYTDEHKAHVADSAANAQTVANYRAAAEQARLADKANAERVKALGDQISKEQSDEYQKRIADARARAERLRTQDGAGKADPCRPATAPVPGVPATAGGSDEAACKAGLPPADALTATEQAIQLDELIKWVNRVVGINPNAPNTEAPTE